MCEERGLSVVAGELKRSKGKDVFCGDEEEKTIGRKGNKISSPTPSQKKKRKKRNIE